MPHPRIESRFGLTLAPLPPSPARLVPREITRVTAPRVTANDFSAKKKQTYKDCSSSRRPFFLTIFSGTRQTWPDT